MASLLSRALFRHHSARNNFVRSLCTISTAQQSVLPRGPKKQLTERRKKVISTSNYSLDQKKIPLVEDLARKHETQLLKKSEEQEGNMHAVQKELVARGHQSAEKVLRTDNGSLVERNKKEQNVTVKGKLAEAHLHEKEAKQNFTDKKKDERKHQENAEKKRQGKEQEQTVVVKRELAKERLHEEGANKDAIDKTKSKRGTKDQLKVKATKKRISKRAKKDERKGESADVGKKMECAKRQSVALATVEKIEERNRKRFYYLREGLPYLPAALVIDESATQELVSYASKTAGVSDEDIPLFSVNPSLLGLTQSDLNNAFMKLCKAGFTKEEAAIVLPHYPTNPDFSTIYQVCKLLQRHDIEWKNLISDSNCKYSFLHGTTQLRRNLITLRAKFGLTPLAVEKLLLHLPMLFCSLLSDQTIAAYTKVKAAGFNNSVLCSLLADSLECWAAKISPIGPEAAEIVALLRGLSMNPNAVLVRHPHFFSMKASSFASLIKQLSGAPLYIDTHVLHKAIITIPHLVKEMASLEESTLRKHFEELHQLYQPFGKLLFNSPALLSPSCVIREKLKYLTSLGFTNDQTRKLVKQVPSLLVQDMEKELKPRMELLLRWTDGSTRLILDNRSKAIFTKDLKWMQARAKYAQNHKVISMVSEDRLHKLFLSSKVEFTKMCRSRRFHKKVTAQKKEEGLVENNHTSDK